VVGGGLSGLTAARTLQRRGAKVVVLEQADRVGGRATTDALAGFSVDAGAQLFGSTFTRFLSLVREIGWEDRLVRTAGRDAIWRDGRAHEVVYGSVASMVASGGLPMRTKMRLASRYLPFLSRHRDALDQHAPERAAAAGLDDESIEVWGRREIDEAFVESLAYPQLGAYYGSEVGETSAGFYHILAGQGTDMALHAVRGGVGGVMERLAERLVRGGGEVRTGAEVRQVGIAEGDVRVGGEWGEEEFDGVVAAAPAPRTRAMLDGEVGALREWLAAVRYRPALSMALLADRPVGVRYFGLSFPRGATRFVVAAAVQENKDADLVPPGKGLLVAFATPAAAPALLDLDSRSVLDRMLPEIARALPGFEPAITQAKVYRWADGMPVFFPGYLRHLGAFRADPPEAQRIAIAGDYLYGPSVEGAVSAGLAAAERLAARLEI
jgi:protoporphyrinogen/coproporphyrinogen III oxidase